MSPCCFTTCTSLTHNKTSWQVFGAAALHPSVSGCGLYAPQDHRAFVEKPSSHSVRAVGLHPGQAGIALIGCSSEGTWFSFGTTLVIRQQPRVQVIMEGPWWGDRSRVDLGMQISKLRSNSVSTTGVRNSPGITGPCGWAQETSQGSKDHCWLNCPVEVSLLPFEIKAVLGAETCICFEFIG